jgi:hypothetical protein
MINYTKSPPECAGNVSERRQLSQVVIARNRVRVDQCGVQSGRWGCRYSAHIALKSRES